MTASFVPDAFVKCRLPRLGGAPLAACAFLLSTAAIASKPISPPVLPEILRAKAEIVRAERDGGWEKSLLVSFPERRTTLATYDGLVEAMAVMNHAAAPGVWATLRKDNRCDGRAYIDGVSARMAERLGRGKGDLVKMGTAADMDNLATVTLQQAPFTVSVLVTAGAESNALRTGTDMGTHVEGAEPAGTINIILLTNARMTVGAMARAIVTVTEAKTAALQDLKVPSSYTKSVQATGTGTDGVIVVSANSGPMATHAGGHSLLGSLIGKAAHQAVIEALGKQNGFFLPDGKGR